MRSDANAPAVSLALPFAGRWRVENSPARRVPSHGTNLFATTYAIDFVGVDERGRTAPSRSWRTLVSTEPAELFYAFGRPILAPVGGRVASVHDGEVDHGARRSVALVPYLLGQAGRARQGANALAGNHILIETSDGGAYVGLMHLRSGSVRVAVGQLVTVGEQVAECGNSGNSTQPHVHVQAMDAVDPLSARGLPIAFTRFEEKPARGGTFVTREHAVPGERSIVASLS
ncbi:M23 family metallopeptidase [Occultella gossypii]|uniref:M23 family metallopeptidase n=1 Tax=Occultella gossypii TaxID=2800820 RepID=A0ABS7S791_9MICO|nr:M23 family metallopeptidase [Occultella gossypii]MBZ2196221.1 M23 family metallopeptidase [Occultella gossypii]